MLLSQVCPCVVLLGTTLMLLPLLSGQSDRFKICPDSDVSGARGRALAGTDVIVKKWITEQLGKAGFKEETRDADVLEVVTGFAHTRLTRAQAWSDTLADSCGFETVE